MKQKNYTPLYAVLQVIVWGGFGVIVSYAVGFLERFMPATQVGILLGVVGTVAFFAQFGLAALVTRIRWLTLKRLLILLGLLSVLLCLALFLLPLLPLWRTVLYCAVAISVQALPALVNALGMTGVSEGLRINFGVARGFGSASFAICARIAGTLTDQFNYDCLSAMYLVLAVLLVMFAAAFPKASSESGTATNQRSGSLWKNSRLITALIGAALLYVSHNFLCSFLLYVVQRCGGNEANQGVCLEIAAFCELPVMFLFFKMLKLRSCGFWLKLSGVFMGLRVFGCYLAPNIGTLYAVQFFQLLGFALFSVSSVLYIDSVVEAKDTIQAQTLLASTCTLSNIIAFLLGGVLLDRLGINPVLLIATVSAVLGTAILILFAGKPKGVCGTGAEVTTK